MTEKINMEKLYVYLPPKIVRDIEQLCQDEGTARPEYLRRLIIWAVKEERLRNAFIDTFSQTMKY